MKKLFILIILLGPLYILNAKSESYNWQMGVSLGARYDNILNTPEYRYSVSPEIGVFAKRKIYRRFSGAISLSCLKNKETHQIAQLSNAGSIIVGSLEHRQLSIFSYLGITYNYVQRNNLELYCGAGIGNRHLFSKTKTKSLQEFGWYNTSSSANSIAYSLYIGTGGNYNIHKRWKVNINGRLETVSSDLLHLQGKSVNMGPVFIPTIQAGISYLL